MFVIRKRHGKRFDELAQGETFNFTWYMDVLVAQGMMQSFVSLFHYALFDRFPTVKMVVLESQAGWIGYLLDRMDAVYKVPLGKTTGMKESPTRIFSGNVGFRLIRTRRRCPQ